MQKKFKNVPTDRANSLAFATKFLNAARNPTSPRRSATTYAIIANACRVFANYAKSAAELNRKTLKNIQKSFGKSHKMHQKAKCLQKV